VYDHERIPVPHPAELEPIQIDRDIAALIRGLWRLGIQTEASCQNVGPGSVWILFSSADDARRFLTLVANIREVEGPEAADELYRRVTNLEGGWELEVGIWDENVLVDETGELTSFCGPPELMMPVAVRFPISDYFRVLHLVRG
jgi:hypothetical protein